MHCKDDDGSRKTVRKHVFQEQLLYQQKRHQEKLLYQQQHLPASPLTMLSPLGYKARPPLWVHLHLSACACALAASAASHLSGGALQPRQMQDAGST